MKSAATSEFRDRFKGELVGPDHPVCPVGVVGRTGVAGLTLCGGMGRLQRKYVFRPNQNIRP